MSLLFVHSFLLSVSLLKRPDTKDIKEVDLSVNVTTKWDRLEKEIIASGMVCCITFVDVVPATSDSKLNISRINTNTHTIVFFIFCRFEHSEPIFRGFVLFVFCSMDWTSFEDRRCGSQN